MCQVDIQPLQKELEDSEFSLLEQWDKKAQGDCSRKELTALCDKNANTILKVWWELADRLIAKYSNGYINPKPRRPEENQSPVGVGYPADWLGLTNYKEGPITYDMQM